MAQAPADKTSVEIPLVNPTIASAAVAACVGPPGREIALIAQASKQTLAQMAHGRIGYAVDAATGEIFPPGAALPESRLLFASVRIALPAADPGPDAVLDVLATLAGTGWRLERQAALVPALDHSVGIIRATPADLPTPHAAAHGLDGAGVLVGVVDFGCDFGHPAFLDAAGRTRLSFLWDQNGLVHEQADIDAALRAADPYAALDYWPDRNCYAPAVSRGDNGLVHGTHVLGVAAGRGTGECPAGVAPGALLAFVHLKPGALVTAGDPADVFDGVCAIFDRADTLRMPAVVNLSLGANLGSHDGNTLYDRALDAVLSRNGRAITVAAGNERQSMLNVDGEVIAGTPVRLSWKFQPGDQTDNTMRIFCEGGAGRAVTCSVEQNGVALSAPIQGGANAAWLSQAGNVRGMVYSGLSPTPGPAALQHIEIRFKPSGIAEQVDVVLSTGADQAISFDAWIDRDDRQEASQSHFELAAPQTRSTIVGTACGNRTVCVGAFDQRAPAYLAADFSAEGLTRDDRKKPDLCAPGVGIVAAKAYGGRITAQSPWQVEFKIPMNGTSVAAPHVAGVLALMLQVSPTLSADDGARILRETSRLDPTYVGAAWHPQCGSGRVDAAAAVGRLLA